MMKCPGTTSCGGMLKSTPPPGPSGTFLALRSAAAGPGFALRLLDGLAVQRQIEALPLDVFADPQPNRHVDEFENDQGYDHVVDEHAHDADDLIKELAGIAFDQA